MRSIIVCVMICSMRYLLGSNRTLIVRGPSSVRLLSGRGRILGAPLDRERIIIRKEKQLPIEAITSIELEILRSESGRILEIEGSSIPASWNAAVEALAEMGGGRVIVIGGGDVGKSTLCTYLTNQLLERGLKLRVLDADVGQADIGPPTTVGSATPYNFISSLVDLNPEALIFIGDTSPNRVENKLIGAIRRLADHQHDKPTITLINTDGWILDSYAISYKIKMISSIQPDLVLELSTGSELQPILSGSRARSLKVAAANEVLMRSRSDRRAIRTTGYRRFLDGASVRALPFSEVQVLMPNGLTPLQVPFNPKLKNVIVGLLDEKGYLSQIGILLGLEKDVVRLYSRAAEDVRRIEVGYLKLSKGGSELGYVE
jgi:polynucleotide 5'-hydroxyl-kinase GRC3/NOL9